MKVLGIRHGHDSAACLVIDGDIIADIAEERLTRKKNDGSFPVNAIEKCLEIGGISSSELDIIAVPTSDMGNDFAMFFHDIMSKRIEWVSSEQYKGDTQQISLKGAIKNLIFKGDTPAPQNVLARYLPRFTLSGACRIVKMSHHFAHAASAYYTSGLKRDDKSLVAVLDGRGDNLSASLWRGEGGRLTNLCSHGQEASLGWFYAAATEALGWRHGSDEWKVMGLAPYGSPKPGLFAGMHPVFEDGRLKEPSQPLPGPWNKPLSSTGFRQLCKMFRKRVKRRFCRRNTENK